MRRDIGQPSLAESLIPEKLGRNAQLRRIAQVLDWGPFQRVVARADTPALTSP